MKHLMKLSLLCITISGWCLIFNYCLDIYTNKKISIRFDLFYFFSDNSLYRYNMICDIALKSAVNCIGVLTKKDAKMRNDTCLFMQMKHLNK
jgi:hypothetical protein